jgi:hypothetical protein
VNLSSAAGQNVSPIGLVSGNNLEHPNLAGNPNAGPQTAAEWFNTSAFGLPAHNTFGSAGRNVVTGPGLATLDLSLQKDQTLYERLKLQFRFDVQIRSTTRTSTFPAGFSERQTLESSQARETRGRCRWH